MHAVAAMFEVPKDFSWDRKLSPIEGVTDSKKFSSRKAREVVFRRILKSSYLVDFGLGEATVEEINEHGIDEANRLAFYRAWSSLKPAPSYMLVDGDKPAPAFSYSQQMNKPKADFLWWPVGAASILAKVIRDNHMAELGADFPCYDWASNAGYGSPVHLQALKEFGASPLHRSKFVLKTLREE
jgi:ribonuclease HII